MWGQEDDPLSLAYARCDGGPSFISRTSELTAASKLAIITNKATGTSPIYSTSGDGRKERFIRPTYRLLIIDR